MAIEVYGAGGANKEAEQKTVTPTTSQQTVTPTDEDHELTQVTVNAMPSGALADISVSSAGLVTSKVGTSGYLAANTSKTKQLTTKAGQSYTPGTEDKTIINSGVYTTGAQVVKGDANLVAGNIAKGKSIFGINGSYTGDVASIVQGTQKTNQLAFENIAKNRFVTLKESGFDKTNYGEITQPNGLDIPDADSSLYLGGGIYIVFKSGYCLPFRMNTDNTVTFGIKTNISSASIVGVTCKDDYPLSGKRSCFALGGSTSNYTYPYFYYIEVDESSLEVTIHLHRLSDYDQDYASTYGTMKLMSTGRIFFFNGRGVLGLIDYDRTNYTYTKVFSKLISSGTLGICHFMTDNIFVSGYTEGSGKKYDIVMGRVDSTSITLGTPLLLKSVGGSYSVSNGTHVIHTFGTVNNIVAMHTPSTNSSTALINTVSLDLSTLVPTKTNTSNAISMSSTRFDGKAIIRGNKNYVIANSTSNDAYNVESYVFTLGSDNIVTYAAGKKYAITDLPTSAYSYLTYITNIFFDTDNPDVFVLYWLYNVNTTWSYYNAYIRKFYFVDGYVHSTNEKEISGISLNDAGAFTSSLKVLTV